MAFENIGLGGVLTFESGKAVTNMGKAERGFLNLRKSAELMQSGMNKMGSVVSGVMSKINLLGAVTSAALVAGFVGAIREGLAFNRTMENAKLAISSILQTVKEIPLAQAIAESDEAMKRLVGVAAQAPGELEDSLLIFQMMAGPMSKAGANMDDILQATLGTQIAAGQLNIRYADAAKAMAKLQAGQVEMGSDFIILLRSMGLIKETTKEWKALTPVQQLQRVKEITSKFAKDGERVGATMEAQLGTVASMRKELLAMATRGIFERMRSGMASVSAKFFESRAEALGLAEAVGRKLGAVFDFLIQEVFRFGRSVNAVFGKTAEIADVISGKLKAIGIHLNGGVLKGLASSGIQTGLWLTALSPIILILTKVVGLLASAATFAAGAGAFLAGIAVPLGIAAAAVGVIYMAFRDNAVAVDSLKNSLGRVFALIQNLGSQVGPIFDQLKASFLAVVDAVQPGFNAIGRIISGIVDLFVTAAEQFLPKIMTLVQPLIRMFQQVYTYAAKVFTLKWTFLEQIFNGISTVLKTVIFPILGVLADVVIPAIKFGMKVIEIIFKAVSVAVEGITTLVKIIAGWLGDHITPILEGMKPIIASIGEFLRKYLVAPIEWATEKLSFFTDILDDISNIIGGPDRKTIKEGAIPAVSDRDSGRAVISAPREAPLSPAAMAAREAARAQSAAKGEEGDKKVKVGVKVGDTNVCVDGRKMAVATARHQTEITERAGAEQTAYQQRFVNTQGFSPV